MNRRGFLRLLALGAGGAALGALGLAPRGAHALGPSSRFTPAIARHGGNWNARPNALRRLAFELAGRTSVEVFPEARPVGLAERRLFDHPFLYLCGDGPFPPLGEDEVANLRRYLTYGGFMLADASDGSDGSGFDASLRRELARVMPGRALARMPGDHVLFKTFYLMDRYGGRLLVKPYLEALTVGGRAAVVYSQNDLGGAWSRDERGSWEYEVVPGGESQREQAIRLGINLAMYALCLDYKEDAVHLPFIMKRRR